MKECFVVKTKTKFWYVALSVSAVVHLVFGLQALSVAAEGGMVRNSSFLIAFYPQLVLMYFLPPPDPINYSGNEIVVNWFYFIGKLVVTYPASFCYGLVASAIWQFLRRNRTA